MQKTASFLRLGAGMAVKSAAEVLPPLVGIDFGESRAKVTDQTTVFWFLRYNYMICSSFYGPISISLQ
jgi:hypothetical protein